jgi:hypothetical protein
VSSNRPASAGVGHIGGKALGGVHKARDAKNSNFDTPTPTCDRRVTLARDYNHPQKETGRKGEGENLSECSKILNFDFLSFDFIHPPNRHREFSCEVKIKKFRHLVTQIDLRRSIMDFHVGHEIYHQNGYTGVKNIWGIRISG